MNVRHQKHYQLVTIQVSTHRLSVLIAFSSFFSFVIALQLRHNINNGRTQGFPQLIPMMEEKKVYLPRSGRLYKFYNLHRLKHGQSRQSSCWEPAQVCSMELYFEKKLHGSERRDVSNCALNYTYDVCQFKRYFKLSEKS